MAKPIEFKPSVPRVDGLTETETLNELAKFFFENYEIKEHVTAAPTYSPKNFFEQIVFYDDGANRRIYLFINNTWRYVALT